MKTKTKIMTSTPDLFPCVYVWLSIALDGRAFISIKMVIRLVYDQKRSSQPYRA